MEQQNKALSHRVAELEEAQEKLMLDKEALATHEAVLVAELDKAGEDLERAKRKQDCAIL